MLQTRGSWFHDEFKHTQLSQVSLFVYLRLTALPLFRGTEFFCQKEREWWIVAASQSSGSSLSLVCVCVCVVKSASEMCLVSCDSTTLLPEHTAVSYSVLSWRVVIPTAVMKIYFLQSSLNMHDLMLVPSKRIFKLCALTQYLINIDCLFKYYLT